jgi:hypothetical protein
MFLTRTIFVCVDTGTYQSSSFLSKLQRRWVMVYFTAKKLFIMQEHISFNKDYKKQMHFALLFVCNAVKTCNHYYLMQVDI